MRRMLLMIRMLTVLCAVCLTVLLTMSSIKHLEMAAALSVYTHIEIKKSLFSTKAIYTPTLSQVKAYILEYSDGILQAT